MKNIYIEGIQGTGKTTLLRLLGQQLPEYHVYWEGDYCPVELAWCTYMTEAEYQQSLADFSDLEEEIKKRTTIEDDRYIVEYTRVLAERREFYEYMERFELYNGRKPLEEYKQILLTRYKNFNGSGNIFECSFFQNTMEELLLYYDMSEQEIVEFYRELFVPLKDKDFVMVYLQSDVIEENILQIKKERSDSNGTEMWYPLMLRYLNETPYGKKHPFEGVADMAKHFHRRMEMELSVIEKVIGSQAIVVPAKAYELEELVKQILSGEEMEKNYTEINSKIIDRWCEEDWEWGKPISHEEYEKAVKGEWQVVLTPTKPVPKDWFCEMKGANVLGLASGGGQQMPIFAALGAECTVLDYSDAQLASEKMVAEREGYRIHIVKADMTKPLPFADESFDLIFHPVSNCYVEEVLPIWKECYRVLKKGGILLAGLDNGVNYIFDSDTESVLTYKLPFNPLRDEELYKFMVEEDWGIQFSHTIEEQIGGQLAAGFSLEGVYEDTNGSGKLHEYHVPTFWATKSVKR